MVQIKFKQKVAEIFHCAKATAAVPSSKLLREISWPKLFCIRATFSRDKLSSRGAENFFCFQLLTVIYPQDIHLIASTPKLYAFAIEKFKVQMVQSKLFKVFC